MGTALVTVKVCFQTTMGPDEPMDDQVIMDLMKELKSMHPFLARFNVFIDSVNRLVLKGTDDYSISLGPK